MPLSGVPDRAVVRVEDGWRPNVASLVGRGCVHNLGDCAEEESSEGGRELHCGYKIGGEK